jgi:hypothetical protein
MAYIRQKVQEQKQNELKQCSEGRNTSYVCTFEKKQDTMTFLSNLRAKMACAQASECALTGSPYKE